MLCASFVKTGTSVNHGKSNIMGNLITTLKNRGIIKSVYTKLGAGKETSSDKEKIMFMLLPKVASNNENSFRLFTVTVFGCN